MEVSPDTTTQTMTMYDYINNIFMTPGVFIILVVVIVIYLVFFLSLGNTQINFGNSADSGDSKSKWVSILSIIFIFLFVLLVFLNGFQYFFGVDIVASIKDIFSGEPVIDIKVDETKLLKKIFTSSNSSEIPGMDASYDDSGIKKIRFKKQVFNIPGNEYNYEDAKSLCKAYGARLANYNEIEDSYKAGGEWCNYGWSEGQMALFPTQKDTYSQLKKIPGHENDCGRPGVNGGYMANPNIRFGVNCYGYKPVINDEEKQLMLNTQKYPKTMKDIEMEKRVDYWRNKIPDILVGPFNSDKWSRV